MNKIENAQLSDRAINQISDVVIPMIKKRDKEIERLKQDNEYLNKVNIELSTEKNRLNNIINKCTEDILKELEENHHLSYGVALAIRQKLLDYKELKGEDKE